MLMAGVMGSLLAGATPLPPTLTCEAHKRFAIERIPLDISGFRRFHASVHVQIEAKAIPGFSIDLVGPEERTILYVGSMPQPRAKEGQPPLWGTFIGAVHGVVVGERLAQGSDFDLDLWQDSDRTMHMRLAWRDSDGQRHESGSRRIAPSFQAGRFELSCAGGRFELSDIAIS